MALLLSYAILTVWIEERWAWSLFQLAIFAAATGWAARQLFRPSRVAGCPWLVPLCAAPAWGLLQLALHTTVYRWATWNAVLNWTTYLAAFFLALQIFQRPAARYWFLRFAIYFGFALSVLATVQLFTSGGRIFWLFPSGYRDFVLGPFVYRNQYAAFLETILPIALWQALGGTRWSRRGFTGAVMAAAMFASVVAAASRAGSVLLCLETIAVLLLARSRGLVSSGTVARSFAKIAVAAVVFVAIAGWDVLWLRFQQPDPYAGRRELLTSSLAMLRDRPVMGFGLGNWPRAYPHYALFDDGTYVNQAHNDWAQWAVEGGVPFFAILLSLVAMAFPAAVRSLWGIGLLSVWLHCLVEYPLQQRPALGAWFFVLLGVLAGIRMHASRGGGVHLVPEASRTASRGETSLHAPTIASAGRLRLVSLRWKLRIGRD